MPLYLTTSPARREFKKHLGNANHLIITALVGLDAVEKGYVTEVPKELRAAWSPKDPRVSSQRSRRLVLDMALVRSVDALDLYISRANRKPFLIQSSEIRSELDKNGRSVYRRFKILENHFTAIDKKLSALVALMITWRNRAVHSDEDKELSECYRNCIRDNIEAIQEKFRGLDGLVLLDHYDKCENPRFKEVASFINSTHHYVKELEQFLFQSMCPKRFLKEIVWKGVPEYDMFGKVDEHRRKKLLQGIWGKSSDKKERAIKNFFEHWGLSLVKPKDEENFLLFEDCFLEEIISKTPKEMFNWASTVE